MLRRIIHKPQPPALATAHAAEARENIASIRAIPQDELPDAEARATLVALAEAGYDVYAYRPLGLARHVIWIRPEWPYQDGRMTPAEWMARYRQSQQRQASQQGAQLSQRAQGGQG